MSTLSKCHQLSPLLVVFAFMNLKKKTIENLKEIIKKDYDVLLNDEEINKLGISLLRLSKIASVAFARVDEKNSSIQARGRHPLGAKTSMQKCVPLQALGESMQGL